MSRGPKLLFRLGAAVVPRAVDLGRRAGRVLRETRDAFGRGLRGEPEPPPARPISPEEIQRWYANLEVEPGADLDEIHAAWKRLQRRYHPDVHAADAERSQRATELVQQLNEAYHGLRRHLGADG